MSVYLKDPRTNHGVSTSNDQPSDNGLGAPQEFLTKAPVGLVTFDRPILSWAELKPDATDQPQPKKSRKLNCKECCTAQNCKIHSVHFIKNILPCVETLSKYKWGSDFPKDLTGGLTIGVMNIPQGMAYAMLAGLPPVYGLYVSFLGPIFYAFLGRCTEYSMGTFAVVSLLVAGPIEQRISDLYPPTVTTLDPNKSGGEIYFPETNSTVIDHQKGMVAVTLTFLIGIVQLIIGLCRLGTFTSYMAPAMVSGYIAASGLHVLSSQIATLFGVRAAKKGQGIGSIFTVYVNLIKNIQKTNMVTLLISSITIVVLLMIKLFIEPGLRSYFHCSFPIPAELIVVTIGTITSVYMKLDTTYNVSIVGNIARGMPEISIPRFDAMHHLVLDALIIGFVTTFLSISLVKLFAMKNNITMDYNQELVSFGLINLVTSFFSCFVQSGSLSRSMVLAGTGTQTPLAGIWSGLLIIFVLLFLGPYFEPTPTCVLAAIIAVALKNVIMQPKQLPYLWRTYKSDFFLFLITYIATIILDVTYGVLVGIVCCMVVLTERERNLEVFQMKNVPGTELFLRYDDNFFKTYNLEHVIRNVPQKSFAIMLQSISAYRIMGSLNFCSSELFTEKLMKAIRKKEKADQIAHVESSTKPDSGDDTHLTKPNKNLDPSEIPVIRIDGNGKYVGSPDDDRNTSNQLMIVNEAGDEISRSNHVHDEENGKSIMETIEEDKIASDLSSVEKGTKRKFFGRRKKRNIPKINELPSDPVKFILFDISGMSCIDPAGAAALSDAHRALFRKGYFGIICGDPSPFKSLSTTGWDSFAGLDFNYPTLYDACAACIRILCTVEDPTKNRRLSLIGQDIYQMYRYTLRRGSQI